MKNNSPLSTFKLSIVMPVYNEESFVFEIIDAVLATPYQKELLVIDDGSTDGTREKLLQISHPDVKVILHEKNIGKGGALQTGFRKATGDIILIQDADLEYDPSEYPILLEPIIAGKADVVYGSRFAGFGAHRVLYFWHYMGNKFLTLLSNFLTDLNLTDIETCYKVFTKAVLQDIEIREKRFGFEPEITAKIAKKKGLRIYEVPIFGVIYAYNQPESFTRILGKAS
ncbi:MAG: glycosyl transferase [Desulfobacteraceae bacterium 4572_88]|nr:MAG: glycosyl transferase [Desulfobacteraceae bacterium 4572_88]